MKNTIKNQYVNLINDYANFIYNYAILISYQSNFFQLKQILIKGD